MRGNDNQQEAMFSYVSMEKRVPEDHPLRRVRAMTDAALQRMSPQLDGLYAPLGRPSIAPERLLRALLLQALYSVRSERQLMERLDYDLLFRWFVGLSMDERVWDETVFTKNRDRLLDGEIAQLFFEQVLAQAAEHQLLSDEHFTVDGTLIEAWASRRSFKEKKDPPERGSGRDGKKLLRDTHESETDPEARLYKKSTAGEAKPGYLGHVVMENRNGLVMKPCVTEAGTRQERDAALQMLAELLEEKREKGEAGDPRGRVTVGGDKGYQEQDFIEGLRKLSATPHIAEYEKNRRDWLTASEREDGGFRISQKKRKLVEKIFGWLKVVAGLRKSGKSDPNRGVRLIREGHPKISRDQKNSRRDTAGRTKHFFPQPVQPVILH
jgi:transposase